LIIPYETLAVTDRKSPPAFPRPASEVHAASRVELCSAQEGMGLRDYFAAQALAALLAPIHEASGLAAAVIADRAYEFADAMLRARARA
jgi:hypothetical protein